MITFQNAATFSIVLKKVSTANFRQRKLLIILLLPLLGCALMIVGLSVLLSRNNFGSSD